MNRVQTEKTHFLRASEIIARRDDVLVSTILGSCVSVCLWDKVRSIGGINHYMLPLWFGTGLQTPKYGDIAIPRLIEKMIALGSRKEDLIAKVFGGAAVIAYSGEELNVGQRNAQIAEELLHKEGIPIRARDLGGTLGRKLLYRTGTGVVMVRKIKPGAMHPPG